jgi:putative ABC transport system ATP-binding protein
MLVEMRQASRMWTADAGLHPIDLEIDAGEFVVVRGRSGSGKSTLLALLAGLCEPGSGDVLMLGDPPHRSMPWTHVALVPQVLALAVELTIRENVVDGAPVEHRGRADALLRELDLLDLADRGIGEVSMGQQQRAALARAVLVSPRLLLADEPTSFQDGRHTATVVDTLRRAAAAGSAVLAVTHEDALSDAAHGVIELTAH